MPLKHKYHKSKKKKNNTNNNVITLELRRHSNKNILTGKLTKKGLKNARKVGRKINKKKILKRITSQETRAKETIKQIDKNFKGSNKTGKILTKKELNENNAFFYFNENNAFFYLRKTIDFFKNLAGNQKIAITTAKKWLDGKISLKIMQKPEVIADIVIKKRIGSVLRYLRMSKSKPSLPIHIESITHAGIIMPVYERLTGKKYFENYKQLPNENQPLSFDFFVYEKGKTKVIMHFNETNFDVTERVNEIIRKK
jgi:broad specificity phosphatase PhoE